MSPRERLRRSLLKSLFGCLGLVSYAAFLWAWQNAPLTITAAAPPPATTGSHYNFPVTVTGGTPPYHWQVVAGKLPPGLRLGESTGEIDGVPGAPGKYHFTIAVSDGSVPPTRVQREFTITVEAGLIIDWKQPPRVIGDSIRGSVVVANHSSETVTLTVVVVAVNDISRATALGYQELPLQPNAEQVIPFGSAPGTGQYVVHADAVGELESSNSIYRARKQTDPDRPLVIEPPL